MKKYYSILLGLIAGLLASCSDNDGEDPYIPTPPQVTILNHSGTTTCLPGETIKLEAKLDNHLPTTLNWLVDKKEVSTESVYRFTSTLPGTFEIILTATNKDGMNADTLLLEVNRERFSFSDIKHWTGEGTNSSILAIQWVTGNNLLKPADDQVFFIAWGYRWDDANTPKGIDMLKAIAQNDPRLYIVLAGNYVIGFGYDGNNDGKLELQSSTLQLTQDDFRDGITELSGGYSDEIKTLNPDDYWIGSSATAYTSYWLGSGEIIPAAEDFEYSQTFIANRKLENLSWDVWTHSPLDYTSMVNTFPIPRLIKAAETNNVD